MKIDLLKHAEICQTSADEMAYNLYNAGKLALIQSICDFNIFWLSEISPVICGPVTIDFFYENRQNFKRKLSIGEFLRADLIVSNFTVDDFNHFKTMYTNYTINPNMFNNLNSKA